LKALLNYLVDLCLLRAAPQDLPASSVLLILLALLNILTGWVMIAGSRPSLFAALAESAFESLLMLGVLYAALRLRRHAARFLQAGAALMGSELLLGLLAMPLVSWSNRSESGESGLLLLGLIIWSMVVMGHILRHTFDLKFNLGLGLALLYTLISWNLSAIFFPVTL